MFTRDRFTCWRAGVSGSPALVAGLPAAAGTGRAARHTHTHRDSTAVASRRGGSAAGCTHGKRVHTHTHGLHRDAPPRGGVRGAARRRPLPGHGWPSARRGRVSDAAAVTELRDYQRRAERPPRYAAAAGMDARRAWSPQRHGCRRPRARYSEPDRGGTPPRAAERRPDREAGHRSRARNERRGGPATAGHMGGLYRKRSQALNAAVNVDGAGKALLNPAELGAAHRTALV